MNDLIGQTFSHYRIVGLLGAGGMGVVYRAHDERLGRDVALKILPCDMMNDETAKARLLGEARTISSLSHPSIAHIYDVGEDRGQLFVAMELIEGAPLKSAIPRGGLPSATVARYGAQIADALAFAHERGIIHRDLKSTNVMVTPDGRVKVLDFGLAKRLREEGQEPTNEPDLTATGMVLGTPNYLPPEVLRGSKADIRSDLWSLGVLLYETASGRLPFAGGSVHELAGAIMNEDPDPLSGRVPTGLQMVIARCLAKDPSQRYRSASEVRAALESLDPVAAGGRSRARSRTAWLAGGAVLVAAAIAVVLALQTGALQNRLDGPVDRPRIGSLAVLPLANLSGDPGQEFFADGMTEELITALAPIRSLKVISRTSVMRFKNSKQSLREIAKELDVDGIVEGSVLRAGERVRITAQLIEAAKDRHLWAKSYERDVSDVLGLQSEVARDIAQEIRLTLTPQESEHLAQRRSVNPEAYELYLRGRYEWSKVSEPGVKRAIEFYEKALALDPRDARYSAGIADGYILLTQVLSAVPMKEGMKKAEEYARRALAVNDSSAEAHTSMAVALFFGDWNWAEAEGHVKRAIQLNPGYSTAHLVYSVILAAGGRANEAIEQDRLAMDLDPLSLLVNWNAASTLFLARRYDDAIAQAQRLLEIDPTSHLPAGTLIRIHEERGDYPAALAVLERHLPESHGGKAVVAELRRAYAAGGPTGYWRAILGRSTSPTGASGPDPVRVAMIYLKLGDRKRALALLEKAYADRSGDMLFVGVEPCFEALRDDPRFKSLVRRVGSLPAS